MPRQGQRIKKTRTDEAKTARSIGMPEAQIARGGLHLVDVQNHTEADQRVMTRSGTKRTVRRTTKIEQLAKRGIIDKREAAACEWYAAAHACRYDTVGITARYGESSGGGQTNFDHLPKNAQQMDALLNFEWARRSINPAFLQMFERVVLHGRPLGKLAITFRTVARQLLAHIEARVEI